MSGRAVSSNGQIWDPATYDGERRRLVPSFDLLYAAVGNVVALTGQPEPRVLDLGAGTGLLSAAVLERVPGARLHLVDGSESMLAMASHRLAGQAGLAVSVADLTNRLPGGPFDAVISALAIHHLDDLAKRDLFSRIHRALAPGGVFVNLEQLAGPTRWLEDRYAAAHESFARDAGTTDEQWAAARQRMTMDRCAPLDVQLGWLREIGFVNVDVLVKDWRFGVYAGWQG